MAKIMLKSVRTNIAELSQQSHAVTPYNAEPVFINRVHNVELPGGSRYDLEQMPEATIKIFINGINKATAQSGHLFLWIDKFHLCEGVKDWLVGTEFSIVDLLVWEKKI